MRSCVDCGAEPVALVLVPWISLSSEGASWDPFCEVCLPTAEEWLTLLVEDAAPVGAMVEELRREPVGLEVLDGS